MTFKAPGYKMFAKILFSPTIPSIEGSEDDFWFLLRIQRSFTSFGADWIEIRSPFTLVLFAKEAQAGGISQSYVDIWRGPQLTYKPRAGVS